MFAMLRTAFRTLTRFSWPGGEASQLSHSLYGFPLVGALLGALVWGAGWGFEQLPWAPWPEGEAVFLLGLLAWMTGALHLDGLADFADSFGAQGNREKALAIMKDSASGAFGVVVLVVYLLAWVLVVARLIDQGALAWLAVALVLSRSLMVELMTAYPSARPGGTAGAYIEGSGTGQRLSAALVGLALTYGLFGPSALAAYGLALLATHLFGLTQTKRLGGITGDLIGASCLLNELLILLVALLYRPQLAPWLEGWL